MGINKKVAGLETRRLLKKLSYNTLLTHHRSNTK